MGNESTSEAPIGIDAPAAIVHQHSDNTLEGIADEYNQFGTNM